jgi:chromosome segregation ATPase
LVTVPGKGGRPRKWRSDADRQRAFRARQSGRPEPPTAVQALDDGDELARAWEVVRDLGRQLDGAQRLERDARQELAAARRELAREQRQWGWLEVENARLRTDADRLQAEAAELTAELSSVRAELSRVIGSTTRRGAPQSTGLPRAERRRLAREQRKRRDR